MAGFLHRHNLEKVSRGGVEVEFSLMGAWSGLAMTFVDGPLVWIVAPIVSCRGLRYKAVCSRGNNGKRNPPCRIRLYSTNEVVLSCCCASSVGSSVIAKVMPPFSGISSYRAYNGP